MISRRTFVQSAISTASLATTGSLAWSQTTDVVPSYLKDFATPYAADLRAAAIDWFRGAEFGLFIHYGLYSLLGRHEWVMINEKIRVKEYANLLLNTGPLPDGSIHPEDLATLKDVGQRLRESNAE